MLYNNFPLPLPWYEDVTLQDRFRQNVAENAVVTQLAPKDGVLPFQFRKPLESLRPTTWKIKCATPGKTLADYQNGFVDADVVDLTAFITHLDFYSYFDDVEEADYDYITFMNFKNAFALIAALPDGLPPGVYYMEMDFGTLGLDCPVCGGKWVSETFRVPVERFSWDVPDSECKFICLKWSHNSDIKPMHYDTEDETHFYNLLYLDTIITASEPVYEAIGDNDGNQEFIPSFKKLMVKYRISAMVPDYIKIALFALHLHENKYLFTENALREGYIKNFEISATLQAPDGAYSIVEILCEQITLRTQTTCPEVMTTPGGYEIGDHPTLVTDYCPGTGGVTVEITDDVPERTYGELWGTTGSGYVLLIPYISRADLLAGIYVTITPGTPIVSFKVVFTTFTFVVGESSISVPTPSC